MATPVIHIYGPSGGGITTLGRALAQRLGWTLMDTDDYYWEPTEPPYTVKREPARRIELIEADLREARGAVLTGALAGWGDPLIPRFSLAVRVETDAALRLERLKARESAAFGDRILPGGDMYEDHQAFLAWAMAYDTAGPEQRSRARHDLWEAALPCPTLTLDGGDPVEENADRVEQVWRELEGKDPGKL